MHLKLEIDIPQDVKETIYSALSDLRKDYPYIQWVAKNDYRLELFSFGDKYPKEFLDKKIQDATFDCNSFSLFSHKLRLTIKSNIMIYLSFYENKALKDIIENIKSQLSLNDGLTFYPDIVVARYRIPSKQQYLLIKKKCLNTNVESEFRITQLTLYNSVNEGDLVTYQKETTYPLLLES